MRKIGLLLVLLVSGYAGLAFGTPTIATAAAIQQPHTSVARVHTYGYCPGSPTPCPDSPSRRPAAHE